MNRVELVGRLTAKPELRYTSSNVPFARFTVAVNRTFSGANGERETDFINCVTWRKQAENLCQYQDKGSLISVEGRIQTGSYDAQDGSKRYTTDVVADSIQFLGTKGSSQNTSDVTPYDYQDTPVNDVSVEEDPFADFGDSVSIDDSFLD